MLARAQNYNCLHVLSSSGHYHWTNCNGYHYCRCCLEQPVQDQHPILRQRLWPLLEQNQQELVFLSHSPFKHQEVVKSVYEYNHACLL